MCGELEKIQERKQGIEKKGLAAIENYFDLNSTQLEKKDAEVLRHLYNMARLGMQFEKEINLQKRATEMNFIRICKIVNDSKAEMKAYLKKTMPEYIK